jgi:hypothetical protein
MSHSNPRSISPSRATDHTGRTAPPDDSIRQSTSRATQRTPISVDGSVYPSIRLFPYGKYHRTTHAQVYTGFVVGSTRPAETECAYEAVDGSVLLDLWKGVQEKIEYLSDVWISDRPPFLSEVVTTLRPVIRLPCEGEHLRVQAFLDISTKLDTHMAGLAADVSISEHCYFFQDKWKEIMSGVSDLQKALGNICTSSRLEALPHGAVLRVVSNEMYQDGGFRVCAFSQTNGSLLHFDGSRLEDNGTLH